MTQLRQPRRVVATSSGLLLGALAYLLSLLDYDGDLTRQANQFGYASNFFDLQGRAFLDRNLAVPRGSLGIEGFLIGGREYMYFPPFPAVLRLPVLFVTSEYDGKLTLLSMLLAFVVFATMTVRLVWLVRDLLLDDAPLTRGEAGLMALLIALLTGGTTLTYVAALPWVYHEVYAWAVALAVGSMYWMVRVWREPSPSAIAWLGAFDLALILTRTTGGWAMCLTTMALGAGLLWRTRRGDRSDHDDRDRDRTARRTAVGVVVVGGAALLAGIAFNWVKFSHPYLFPLEHQVWTEVNEHRRHALEAGGGTITGPQYFPSAFMAYFRLDGVRFVDYFPWITLPAEPARSYGGTVVDQSYRTGSVPSLMPWPLLSTLLAILVLVRRRRSAAAALWLPLAGAVLITGGVMAYGYFAYRYTAEFVPALVLGSTIGTVALGSWVRRHGRWLQAVTLTVLAGATAYSIAAQLLIGHAAAVTTYGGAELRGFLELQQRLSPEAHGRQVLRGEALPSGGATDDLWIAGDCDALYLNTGDAYEPWVLATRRSVQVEVAFTRQAEAARFKVIEVTTSAPRSVWIEYDGQGRARIQIVTPGGTSNGLWFDLLEPRTVRVGVRDLPGVGFAEVSATPGGHIAYIASFEWDESWHARLVEILPVDGPDARGIDVRPLRGLASPLCDEISATAR